jgi:alkylation response protein AidB-like acyl-CoA dehydrogenase
MHPYFHPYFWRNSVGLSRTGRDKGPVQRPDPDPYERVVGTYTIFEGTSEIQRLIIARAISGVHIQ